MFLILGKTIFNHKITCAEIVSLQQGRPVKMTEVEVLASDCKALSNDSLIVCHELVTVPVACFDTQMAGFLPEKYKTKVATALRNHLPY